MSPVSIGYFLIGSRWYDLTQQERQSDNNRERTTRPDIVSKNHRQPSRKRDYADGQHHRCALKKGGHRLHGRLSASHHRQRDQNALPPDQPAKKKCAWRHASLQTNGESEFNLHAR